MIDIPSSQARVLIVDDTPINIDILCDILGEEYDLQFATSGEEALELIEETGPPELILLDVLMPGMDGYQVCRQLKEDPFTCRVPIVFVTAKNDAAERAYGLSLGAADYLIKPIEPDTTRKRIRELLQRKG